METNNLLAGVAGGITNPALGDTLKAMSTSSDPVAFFNVLLPNIVTLGFVIGVIVFFFMLVMGAIQWIMSGGDKGNLEAARSKITNAIIGLVVLFSAFAVVNLIEVFFGINIMTLDMGSLIIQ